MLDAELKEQLKSHLSGLGHTVELVVSASAHEQQAELVEQFVTLEHPHPVPRCTSKAEGDLGPLRTASALLGAGDPSERRRLPGINERAVGAKPSGSPPPPRR